MEGGAILNRAAPSTRWVGEIYSSGIRTRTFRQDSASRPGLVRRPGNEWTLGNKRRSARTAGERSGGEHVVVGRRRWGELSRKVDYGFARRLGGVGGIVGIRRTSILKI